MWPSAFVRLEVEIQPRTVLKFEAAFSKELAMTRADKPLKILLRIIGVLTLFALVGMFMPKSWMASTHQWLGLGELPDAPIVENLARSVSAFYALFGAVCLVLAADPE